MRASSLLLTASLLAFGCGTPSVEPSPDAGAGPPDAGAPDAGHPDADGDGIADADEGRTAGVDTDGDGTPDYLDLDSDSDGIPDAFEAGDADLQTPPVDTDADAVPDFRDLDSDGDCVSDAQEARGTPPADTDGDGRADFRDRDSDGDGLGDGAEDANCSGTLDSGETDAIDIDTDDDGATDLVEVAVGTDPTSAVDHPEANGDYVVVVPHQGAPNPSSRLMQFAPRLHSVDLYVLLDRSGSMSTEISTLRTNLATLLNRLSCPPVGSGDPATCFPDLWGGAGTIGFRTSGADAYRNHVDLQPNPSFSGVPVTEAAGTTTDEPLTFAAYAAISGEGGSAYGMSAVPARATCAASPAANAGHGTFGYPCFRQGALPVVAMATDEPPLSPGDTHKTPSWSTVVEPAYLAAGARFVGIVGSGPVTGTVGDLQLMATGTKAVDTANGNAPLVFDGSGTTSATALENAMRTLSNAAPFDLSLAAVDDPADAVDAVSSFVSRFETRQSGALCTSGLTAVDTNGDTFDDAFASVPLRQPVCWSLVAKTNSSVAATNSPQVFRARILVKGDRITELDGRDVAFVVPPLPLD